MCQYLFRDFLLSKLFTDAYVYLCDLRKDAGVAWGCVMGGRLRRWQVGFYICLLVIIVSPEGQVRRWQVGVCLGFIAHGCL